MKKAGDSVICKIEGCARKAMYQAQQVCQKHYFRFMRTGSYQLLPKPQRIIRRQDSRGYWQLYMPDHPLADSTGQVWEHRKIVYDRIGDVIPSCELCGKPLTWKIAHIDHIDENPSNNDPQNLRPLCGPCNTRRGEQRPQYLRKGRRAITFEGETKTAFEWARDPRVSVSGHVISQRKKRGMSDYDALFSPKLTHNGRREKSPPKIRIAHTRSNAVALTINGVTKTASEWSREPGCTVTDGAIRARLRIGWAHERAVFAPSNPDGAQKIVSRDALGRIESTKVRERKKQEESIS